LAHRSFEWWMLPGRSSLPNASLLPPCKIE
jgi:hypothetical protein